MTSPILFCGQEDLSFAVFGGPYSSGSAGPVSIDTTAGRFRSGYSRSAITISNVTTSYVTGSFAATTSFWVSCRTYNGSGSAGGNTNLLPMILRDSSGLPRLRIRSTAQNGGPWAIETVNTAGTAVQIGSNVVGLFPSNPAAANKIDIFVNYAVSGQLTIYLDGTQLFSYTGDITTNSVTTLAQLSLGNSNGAPNSVTSWSECIVSTRDTRNMSLVTQVSSAAGNTDTFTSGAFGNVNQTLATTGQASPDYSATATQVQQYKVGQSIPSGSFSVVSVVQHGQCTVGPDGPQHIEFSVRTGGSDYFTTDMAPSAGWGLLTYNWDTNPNTTVAWQTTDLPSASTSFNLGYKSTA